MNFGDFLGNVLAIGAGFLIGGPLGGAIAGGLIGGAVDGRSGILRGAALGALGAAIGAGFSEAGLFEGAADASTLGTEAATAETLTAGGAPATAASVAPEAATTTEQLAQGTLAGESAPATEIFSPSGGAAGVGEGGSIVGEVVDGGIVGSGTTNIPGGETGLVNSVLSFTKEYPLASVLGLQGVGSAMASVEARKKAERDRETLLELEAARRRVDPSTGGVGVNLNIRPGDPILRRPDGTPVFVPRAPHIASNIRR